MPLDFVCRGRDGMNANDHAWLAAEKKTPHENSLIGLGSALSRASFKNHALLPTTANFPNFFPECKSRKDWNPFVNISFLCYAFRKLRISDATQSVHC
jgi:hypothetical protein